MRPIETPRLCLRPWRSSDVEDMFAYSADPLVGPAAGWACHESIEESRQVIARFIASREVLAVALRETGRVVGSIGLHARVLDARLAGRPQRELGFVLSRGCWGLGYMPEAARAVIRQGFEEMGLVLVTCGHYEGNFRSRRVIEKCGFQYAFPKIVVRELLDGKETVEHVFFLTRERYLERKNAAEDEAEALSC